MSNSAKKDKAIEMVELSNKEAQVAIDMRDSLIALQNNKHFKKVINEGYLLQEAANKARSLASPALQDENTQREIMHALQGIGHLSQYFSVIYQKGNMAENAVNANNKWREEVEAGEVDLDEMEL